MARKHKPDAKLVKVLEIIAIRVEKLRKTREWTQDELAEELGADIRWVQRIESGTHVVSLETLVRLTQVFKVDLRDFF